MHKSILTSRQPRPEGLTIIKENKKGGKNAKFLSNDKKFIMQHQLSEARSRTTLLAGRVYVPALVSTSTWTSPSFSGHVFTTLAMGQREGTNVSSRRRMTSLTSKLHEGWCHLFSLCRVMRYSEDQRHQKCLTIATGTGSSTSRLKLVAQRCSLDLEWPQEARKWESDPVSKCQLQEMEWGVSCWGRPQSDIKLLSALQRRVLDFPSFGFWIFTAASQSPPKWGAHSGMNSQKWYLEQHRN